MHGVRSPTGRDADAPVEVDLRVPRPAWLTRYALGLVALDALAMAAATLTAKISWLGIDPEPLDIRSFSIPYSALVLVTVPTWVAILGIVGAYDLGPFGTNPRVWSRLVRAGAQLLAVIAVAYYVAHLAQLGRGVLVALIPLAVAFTAVARGGARLVLDQLRHHGRARRTALLVGHQRGVETMMHQIDARPDAGVDVVGVSLLGRDDRATTSGTGERPAADAAATNGNSKRNGNVPAGNVPAGNAASSHAVDRAAIVARALARTGAETVIVTSGLEHGQLRNIAWMLEGTGIPLLVSPAPADLQELSTTPLRPVAGLPLLYLNV
jgi:hypothetical protein